MGVKFNNPGEFCDVALVSIIKKNGAMGMGAFGGSGHGKPWKPDDRAWYLVGFRYSGQ